MTIGEFRYLSQTAGDSCVEWPGYRAKGGYGRKRWHGQTFYTHRLAWELANGPIPDGMLVCHRCDNPPCYNVAHLFLGSNASSRLADLP